MSHPRRSPSSTLLLLIIFFVVSFFIIISIVVSKYYQFPDNMVKFVILGFILIILVTGFVLGISFEKTDWPSGISAFLNPIKNPKHSETKAELEKSLSLLKAAFESTADGLLVVDLEGKIIQFNKRFIEMWRIPAEVISSREDRDALNFVIHQLINPDKFLSTIKQLYSKPELITSDLIELKDGRIFERYSQPQMINNSSVGRVWSFRDITERKRGEAEIISAKEKAEESDRLKTAFLHNVSHEIRTPMNAIIGFSTLLNDPEVTTTERTQYTKIILQSGTQLLSIINDIVDIANIETGKSRLKIKLVNINSVLRSLNDQYSIKERSQGVSLNLLIPNEDVEHEILTDGTKLIQVLSNLLNNAIKFTSEGRIDFGYEQKDGFLEFFVTDTGIGIEEENLDKIFNRFYQVNGASSRQYGGTGLGLSICKANVDLMGGTIVLSSQFGIGSTFRFTIPYNVPY
jgi:PAS domain S-box-containing protein